MALTSESKVRNVKGITEDEKQRIFNFLQGAVYCWCKNKKDEWFSLRDLFGGENFDWNGTPLFALFEKHKGQDKTDDEAITSAGIDAGWALKKILNDDQRKFESKKEEMISKYRWKK